MHFVNLCCSILCLFLVIKVSLSHVESIVTMGQGYKAAVLEHVFINSERCGKISDGRQRATCVKMENLDVFEKNAADAARQGAEIIVFPEGGISGTHITRQLVHDFSEPIPRPNTAWCPCNHPELASTAQYRYSCMARRNRLYVVAPSIDHETERGAVSGTFLYNTAVAYNPDGILVAKYHKWNLFHFEVLLYDRPSQPEISYFDTHFGRIGLFICFDVLFQKPAYELVNDHGVTDIAFPTAWIDELPMYSAVGVHSAWAMTMKVNFLSANYRIPGQGMLGSGIYTPEGPSIWTRNLTNPGSILLVTWVPKRHEHYQRPTQFSDIFFVNSPDTFESLVFHDKHLFTNLESGSHRKEVCMDNFCCRLKYTANFDPNEKYALGVFYGLHTKAQQYLHMQNCLVTKCANESHSSCGANVVNARTKFDYFHLEANFRADYVFPQVIKTNVQLTNIGEYEFDLGHKAYILSRDGFHDPIIFAALHGRIYDVMEPENYQYEL